MADVQQGGAVAVRTHSDAPQFLIVTARDTTEHWVFPKSELEGDEEAMDAAIRELLDCGVEGEFSGQIGTSEFRANDRDVEVTYSLIHAVSEVESTTGRLIEWLEYEPARERLTFDDAREFLDTAASRLTAR